VTDAPGDDVPERQLLAKFPPDAARLLRAVHELSFARDLDAITMAARTAARDLTGADGVTFVLREAGHCYYADEDAVAPLWKGKKFPIHDCISGWVMAHDAPVAIADIYSDPRVPHEAYRHTFVRSLAMVPVRAAEPIAAIGAYWADTHLATDDEVGALVLLADSAAMALTNVQLYDELSAALDRERQARVTAEAATAAKDEFLAHVAHELRQPLHASLAALRMMGARVSRESGEHARSVVERQVFQMNRLVEDLLDAARIVRGHVRLDIAVVDLRSVIHSVADSLRPMMAERQHDLVVQVPGEPVMLQADANRLHQVVTNVLTNAAKYTDPGGRIILRVSIDGHRAAIAVIDTGRGIEATALPTIFSLFTRAAPDVRGFGVGLAVARRLVELHGGSIQARSTGAGCGSEFTISLPIAIAATS
jgi:two-component system CheB/CheR fusion protein